MENGGGKQIFFRENSKSNPQKQFLMMKNFQ